MDKCRTYRITRQVLISCLICQVLTNLSVMAIGACIAVDPRKAEVKGHGFIMLILSVMFLCILAAGMIGTIGEYTCILLLFACLMIVGFLVGGLTHLMVFLTSAPQETLQRMVFSLKDYEKEGLIRNLWDYTHEQQKCCGISGPENWLSANMTIPLSCCHSYDGSKDPISENCKKKHESEYLYQRGCFKQVDEGEPALKFQRDFRDEYLPPPPKRRTNLYEPIIYTMVFNYLTKVITIAAALGMAWLLW